MRYGIKLVAENTIEIYIKPEYNNYEDEYYVDSEESSDQRQLELDIENMSEYNKLFTIDGSLENIIIIKTNIPTKAIMYIVSNLTHTYIGKSVKLKNLSREASKNKIKINPDNIKDCNTLKLFFQTQNFTIKKATELINKPFAENYIELLQLVYSKKFMKYDTERRFLKSIKWFKDYDMSKHVTEIAEYRDKQKDGDGDNNRMSTILTIYMEIGNKTIIEKIKEIIKKEQYDNSYYFKHLMTKF